MYVDIHIYGSVGTGEREMDFYLSYNLYPTTNIYIYIIATHTPINPFCQNYKTHKKVSSKNFSPSTKIYTYKFGSSNLFNIFQHMIKSIFSVLVWYSLILFITFNPCIPEWHWGWRAIFVVMSLITIDRTSKNK